MSEQGAAMQTYNQELVKYIEEMKINRALLYKAIELEEEELLTLQNEMDTLASKINQLNDKLAIKKSAKIKLDRVITETEATYSKIVESSQALLNLAKQEASNLNIPCHRFKEPPD